MLPAEREHVRRQALLALEATRLARRSWRSGMGPDFDASWARVRPAVEVVTRESMVGSARNGSVLLQRQLEQAGYRVQPVAQIVPEAFGTQTMLGVDVADALDSSVIRAKQAVSSGAPTDVALERGEEWLDELIRSVMADADRAAQQALTTATPRMGWVRVVPAPCCKHCAVLAGRWYPHSSGFARHPRCDCFHRPAPKDMSGTDDVATADDLLQQGKIKDLTEAERLAIADGADLSAVVNANRGRVNRMRTTEGTTRRGYYSAVQRELDRRAGRVTAEVRTANRGRGTSRRVAPRMTPAAVYATAKTREEAVRLLAANGYMTGMSPADAARIARGD